jgi:hypothetical protein
MVIKISELFTTDTIYGGKTSWLGIIESYIHWVTYVLLQKSVVGVRMLRSRLISSIFGDRIYLML